jgi:uncharacterized membrane protein
MTRNRSNAQALLFVAVALPVFVAISGLAIDGAILLAQRRELQSSVDGAARAGATRVDMQLLRSSGGSDVQLDIERARAAGTTYLQQTLPHAVAWQTRPMWQIEVTRTRVRVTVTGQMQTAFMRVVGVDEMQVGATADASVQYGIRAATP